MDSSSDITIQWQSSSDNRSWINLTGATTASYSVPSTKAAGTYYYKAVLKSGVCSTAETQTVTVTVIPKSVAGTISGAATVYAGTNNTVLTLNGYIGTGIQWTLSATSTGTYLPISGATSDTYTSSNLIATTYYKATVTNGVCSTVTTATAVAIIVSQPAIATSVSGGGAVCYGSTKVLTLASGYVGTIQWQSSKDNNTFTNIVATATSATYTVPSTLNANSIYFFRAFITNGAYTAITSSVTIIVAPAVVTGTLSGPTTACIGTTGNVLSLDNYVGTIQWQSATTISGIYSNIASATSATYTVPTTVAGTKYYKALVTNGGCSSNAPAIGFTVLPLAKATTISGANTLATAICTTSGSVTLTLAQGYVGTIQWQSATTVSGIYTDIGGAVSATYNTTSTEVGATYFRVKMTGTCSVVYSTAVAVYFTFCGAKSANEGIISKAVSKAEYNVKAYPNPFNERFGIVLQTQSDERVNVLVYDMQGKLYDQKQGILVSELDQLSLGENYASGDYLLVVAQGAQIKTVHIVKR